MAARYCILGFLFVGLWHQTTAQQRFSERIRWPQKKEWIRIGSTVSTAGLSMLAFREFAKVPTQEQVNGISHRRAFVGPKREGYSLLSDAFVFGSVALPTIYALGTASENDRIAWGVGFGEAICYTLAITQLSKLAFTAPRPYAVSLDPTAYTQRTGASFFSGHAAVAGAAAAYFIFSREYWTDIPPSKWLLLSTGVLALATASHRVLARSHFPEDVTVGLAVGTGVSYLTYLSQKRSWFTVSISPNAFRGGQLNACIQLN